MTECPDCRAAFEGLPKRCSHCGYQFSSDPKANIATRRNLSLKQIILGCLSVIAMIVGLVLFGGHNEPTQTGTNDPVSNGGRSTYATPRPSPPSARTNPAGIGDTATVVQGNGFWPCGSTTEAYNELMKWAALGDHAEETRTLNRTRSIGIVGGMKVKILDVGLGKRKVRVLTNDAGEAYLKDEQGVFPADPRIGRECWVASEAVR